MIENKIAKLTSYGAYLDCEFMTAKYPDDEVYIVGDLAEYVYDLEQDSDKKDQKIAELEAHIKDMEQEQIAEMKEHTEFAIQARNKIAELEEQVKELEKCLNKETLCFIPNGAMSIKDTAQENAKILERFINMS